MLMFSMACCALKTKFKYESIRGASHHGIPPGQVIDCILLL